MKNLYLCLDHDNPNDLLLVKATAREAGKLEDMDWILEDVTEHTGKYCFVSHNDESIAIGEVDERCKDKNMLNYFLSKELRELHKKSLAKGYDEIEGILECLGGVYIVELYEDDLEEYKEIGGTVEAAEGEILSNYGYESLAGNILDNIAKSRVDGDSGSKYEFMTIDPNSAYTYQELMED